MNKSSKGLSEADIEAFLEFNWDESSDEECEDDDDAEFLEKNLKEIFKRGEESESSLLEAIATEERAEEYPESSEHHVVEKIDTSAMRWRNKRIDLKDLPWENPLEDVQMVNSPIEYFSSFFDNTVIGYIAKETNLYALQESGSELKCTEEEIRRYFGVLLYLGAIKLPSFKMAWSKELKLTAVSDSMSRKKFETIKKYLHFSNNAEQPQKGDPKYDKLYKIRSILSMLKEKCNSLSQEEHQSIVEYEHEYEQVIAYKGRSAFKQYNPAKPHKWGMKMFTRAGSSGIIYDFTLYVGDGTCPSYGLGKSSDIVLYLASSVPKYKNYKLYFDNWFTSFSLLVSLKEMGIFCDPPNSKRYDENGHWVVWGEKGRCRLCKTQTPLSKCVKCSVHLCCHTNKNCFLSYHT